jgi:alpha-L-rhamnosidase
MMRWVDYLQKQSDDLVRDRRRGSDYGDWLSVHADTPKDVIGTAFFAYSTHLVAESCAALGRTEDAAKYDKLFEDIKAAFIKQYVAADGDVKGSTQTSYLLALKFDLLPQDLRAKTAQLLVDNIKARDWHLSTGFVGVGFLLPTLDRMNQPDAIRRLLFQKTYPSWLFPVTHGATTIWERWDGWTPEKGFQDPGMNSFNHYSLGSCGEFLFGGIGGIRPASPGYHAIIIDPAIVKGLTWAKTSYDSIHGKIATDWKVNGEKLVLDVTVPANTMATIYVPSSSREDVTESGSPVEKVDGIKFVRQERNKTVVQVPSGTYHFVSQNP